MIYHILPKSEWSQVEGEYYQPTSLAQDGFIHLCDAEQIQHVCNNYFKGQHGLIVLCVDAQAVTAPIKYEDTSGEGILFPHIYGALNRSAIRQVVELVADADGNLILPPTLERG